MRDTVVVAGGDGGRVAVGRRPVGALIAAAGEVDGEADIILRGFEGDGTEHLSELDVLEEDLIGGSAGHDALCPAGGLEFGAQLLQF